MGFESGEWRWLNRRITAGLPAGAKALMKPRSAPLLGDIERKGIGGHCRFLSRLSEQKGGFSNAVGRNDEFQPL